jgi:hypothetical protein
MEEHDGEGRSKQDEPQDDLDCLPPYDALHDYGEDEEEEAEMQEEEEGGRRTKSAKRAASGGEGKGRKAGVPNIKRERYHQDIEAAEMLATAKSWDGWDWAVVCGGQREGTDVRNMMCISHPS